MISPSKVITTVEKRNANAPVRTKFESIVRTTFVPTFPHRGQNLVGIFSQGKEVLCILVPLVNFDLKPQLGEAKRKGKAAAPARQNMTDAIAEVLKTQGPLPAAEIAAHIKAQGPRDRQARHLLCAASFEEERPGSDPRRKMDAAESRREARVRQMMRAFQIESVERPPGGRNCESLRNLVANLRSRFANLQRGRQFWRLGYEILPFRR
jgi:hypothetical protein